MIGRLLEIAIDARLVARRAEARERDAAARWVAANLAAVFGVPVRIEVPWAWRFALRALGAPPLSRSGR